MGVLGAGVELGAARGGGGGVSGGVVGSGRVEGVSGRVGSQCQSESAKSISKCD